ncbi:substrate-binding periplasmic protein [Pseudoduganella rivuli]|uniref:substrate-binding periplasmic protein n=1 Tax=Pseudoduganella rivuli TaxID=2666085 RepID=UPI0012B01972
MTRWSIWIALVLACQSVPAADLKVGFNIDRPPYVYVDGAGNVAGIEVDVARAALARLGFGMKSEVMSKSRMLPALKGGQADIIMSVHGKDEPGVYYSDGVVEYVNIAISRKADRIRLASDMDLDQYRFVIWQRGWADLGPAFAARYRPDEQGRFRDNYFQSSTQDAQARVFWARRVDVIVVDRYVFHWYRRQLAGSMKTDDEVEYHDIFPNTTVFAAAFADRDVRDRFNAALKAMRADGAYQDIVNRYR